MKLTLVEETVLRAVAGGATLKSHRYLDGRKTYQLHFLDGHEPETVAQETVAGLRDRGLIVGNIKFPAATYLLTDKGRAVAGELVGEEIRPLGVRGYFADSDE